MRNRDASNGYGPIALVVPTLASGGAETMVRNLALALRHRGRDVRVISLYSQKTKISSDIEAAGVSVVFLGKRRGFDPRTIARLKERFVRDQIAVVHTHLPVLKYVVPAVSRMAIAPRIVHTFHSVAERETSSRVIRMQNRAYFRRGQIVPVALSEEVQQSIARIYNLPSGSISIVHNGVDIEHFHCSSRIQGQPARLLHVGRFQKVKNQKFLIDVFRHVSEEFPATKLTLVGDGPLKNELVEYVSRNKVHGVEFAGQQDDVRRFYEQSDILLSASLYEGVPMSILEGMAAGLPVVAVPVGGIPLLVRDGVNGRLSAPNVGEFSRAVCTLVSDPPLRSSLGEQSVIIARDFSSESMAAAYEEQYYGFGSPSN